MRMIILNLCEKVFVFIPGLNSFLVSLALLVGVLISMYAIERFGRKPLMLLSEIFVCVCNLTLGIYFYLKENVSCLDEVGYVTIKPVEHRCMKLLRRFQRSMVQMQPHRLWSALLMEEGLILTL